MKKGIAIMSTVLAAATLLAGCGSGDGDRGTTGGKKVLTYLVSAESEVYNNILDGLLEEFNATIADEGYEIRTEIPGGEYYQALSTKISSRLAPDIMMMEIGNFNAFKRHLLPLDNYLNQSTKLSKNDLWDLNDYYKNDEGKITALIKDFSPDFMLIYHKTMLDAYNTSHPNDQFTISETEPMTWAEYYEMVSTIQSTQGVDYGTSIGFEPIKHLHELVQKTGSTMYTNNNTELNVNDQNVKDAFSFFCALQKDNPTEFPTYNALNKNNGKAPGSYTSGSNMSEQELFKRKRAFSIFNGLYSFAAYDFYNLDFEVGIAPAPVQSEGDEAYATTSAMVSHAIYKNSKYKDIAWRWLEFYQTEGLKRTATIAFNVPGNKTVAGSDAFLANSNAKVQKMTNYFYNFVNSGAVHPTLYNPNISFSRISTCFTTHMSKYYSGQLTFSNLLTEINKSIKASI